MVAKLGSKNSTFLGRGEHLIRIDAVRFVSESDIVLMHLSKTINQTEVIRDVGVPSVFDFDSQTDICVTTGNQNVFLKITEHPAKSFLYYNRIFPAPLNCESEPWIGVIVCQSRVGWYPSSAFAESKGYCGFTHSKFTSVQENLKKIHIALGKFEKFTLSLYEVIKIGFFVCFALLTVCNDLLKLLSLKVYSCNKIIFVVCREKD